LPPSLALATLTLATVFLDRDVALATVFLLSAARNSRTTIQLDNF
jgi:hypothetical protein